MKWILSKWAPAQAVALVGLFLAGSALRAQDSDPSTQTAPKVRVACVGDSITYGAAIKDRKNKNYPTVLGGLLGDGYEVRNFGVNGATLLKKGDRPYWKLDAFRSATSFAPNIVVIKLGTNDTKPKNWKHHKEFIDDYVALVEHFQNLPSKPQVFIAKPVPVVRDRWGIRERIVWEEVVPAVDTVAIRKKVKIIDLYSALKGYPRFFPDGVHPDARGAARVASAVHAAITMKSGSAPKKSAAKTADS